MLTIAEVEERPVNMEDFTVIDPRNGKRFRLIIRRRDNGDVVIIEIRASMGYFRVFNQFQMIGEKAFTSSKTVGPHTFRTLVRRARGGGVA